jgi:hypothetical protein
VYGENDSFDMSIALFCLIVDKLPNLRGKLCIITPFLLLMKHGCGSGVVINFQNKRFSKFSKGDTPLLNYISGLVCRGCKKLRDTVLANHNSS